MFFRQSDIKKQKRQGCWPQKSELGMPQKLEKLNRQFFCVLRPRGVLNRRSLFPSLLRVSSGVADLSCTCSLYFVTWALLHWVVAD